MVLLEARTALLEEDQCLANDESYLADLLSGDPDTCDAWEVLGKVMRAHLAAKATAAAADGIAERTLQRRDRYLKRADMLKRAAADCLREIGQSKAAFADCSITIEPPRLRMVILDESLIPAQYRVTVTTISKAAIIEAMRKGEVVPGAGKEPGEEIVKVRDK
jgi:hypothetical protein